MNGVEAVGAVMAVIWIGLSAYGWWLTARSSNP